MSEAAVDRAGVPREIQVPPGRQIVLPLEGERLKIGDLIGHPGENGVWASWERLGVAHHVGEPLPPAPAVVARTVVPEGYRLLQAGESPSGRSLGFEEHTGEWKPLGDLNALAFMPGGIDANLFCSPIDPLEAIPDWPVPTRHRELGRSEPIMLRDKFSCVSHGKWRQVPADVRGMSTDVFQGWLKAAQVRVVRPIAADFKTWYVDLRAGEGRSNAVGSQKDPFDSIESAERAIEAVMKKLGQQVYGMIMDVRGVPLMAYDLETADLPERTIREPGPIDPPGGDPFEPFETADRYAPGMLPRRGPYAGTHGPIHPHSPEDLDGVVGIDVEQELQDLQREMMQDQAVMFSNPPKISDGGPNPLIAKIETLEERTEAAIEAMQEVLKQLRQLRKEAKR